MNSRHFLLSCNPFWRSSDCLDTIGPSRSVCKVSLDFSYYLHVNCLWQMQISHALQHNILQFLYFERWKRSQKNHYWQSDGFCRSFDYTGHFFSNHILFSKNLQKNLTLDSSWNKFKLNALTPLQIDSKYIG